MRIFRHILLSAAALLWAAGTSAAPASASIRLDTEKRYQHVSGFGGFSPSPQWSYWLSDSDIDKLYGKGEKQLGYNIMRLYISNSDWGWNSAVANAKRGKKYGAYVFASPWSPPASWKDNNSDSNGGHLLESHYADWANYLNRFVTFMKEKGVTIDGISIQNEPDWATSYQSCEWTSQEFIKFLSKYASTINAQILCPEDVHLTHSYIDPILNDSAACANLDIVAGHFYGWNGSSYPLAAEKGKEVWMTEYLINERQEQQGVEKIDWKTDGFLFANSVNDAMLANISAWVHYSLKRYYGCLGDGTHGTKDGQITKRGYVLSHFAKYVSGTTRIGHTLKGSGLSASAYQSVTGDSVTVMVLNPSSKEFDMTFYLPWEARSGLAVVTDESNNMAKQTLYYKVKTSEPVEKVAPWSVSTYVFVRATGATVTVNTAGGGQVDGAGAYAFGDTAVVSASASEGYMFAGWLMDSVLVSTDSVISFIAEDDVVLDAVFSETPLYGLVIDVTGKTDVLGSGFYQPGETASVTAVPHEGHHFICWYDGTDSIADNPYSLVMDGPKRIEAVSAIDRHTVTVNAGAHGTAEGGIFDYGTEVTLEPVPDLGYYVSGWYTDGNLVSSSDSTITFTVKADTVFDVEFAKRTFKIKVQASTGGKASGGGTKEYGDTVHLKAVPDEGYYFSYWMENGKQVSDAQYWDFICTSNHEFKAMFTRAVYTFTASCSAGGTVSPEEKQARYKQSIDVVITPDEGYEIESVTLNGEDITEQVTDGRFKLTITCNSELYVTFRLSTRIGFNETDAVVEYFGIDGRQVTDPGKGLYIVRRTWPDGKQETFKISIK